MVDVSRWLADQRLGHHAKRFAENGIAGDILRDLTDADLKELGLNLGDRKRLLKAIAVLGAGSVQDRMETAEAAAAPATPRDAERRQLTVMFVDLVGSTALAQRLDPEDVREVIGAYHNTTTSQITRFEGHVAKYLGDGVLAYFGWPRAHEDEAERAVRAGLAVLTAVASLRAPGGEPLAARIGVATGLVVVGDLVGQGAAQEEAVVGDTPNLAARLQALAAPGQVVISRATRRLLGASFALEDLGKREIKGISEPVEVFAVTSERTVESRFEAMSGPSVLPMVGRDQELALLLERWSLAKAGEGQGVLLVGEAGIGKSRICRAVLDALAPEPHVLLRLPMLTLPHRQPALASDPTAQRSARSSRKPTACRCSWRSSQRRFWRPARLPYRRRCTIRSWLASTEIPRSRRWRRSPLASAASSNLLCSQRSWTGRRRSSNRRWRSWPPPN